MIDKRKRANGFTCTKCGKHKARSAFRDLGKRRTVICTTCLNRKITLDLRGRDHTPLSWAEVVAAFDLTPQEAKAVDCAARQQIRFRQFRSANPGAEWLEPTADDVVSALGGTVRRQAELLCATSRRCKEILHGRGLDPESFFNVRNDRHVHAVKVAA